jgi:hypothetical protein
MLMEQIPNFGEDEPMLRARIGASFFTKLFRHAYPGGFQFRDSIDSATNSSFAHLRFVSDCLPTAKRR